MEVTQRSPYEVKGTLYGGHPCSGLGVFLKSLNNITTVELSSRVTFYSPPT